MAADEAKGKQAHDRLEAVQILRGIAALLVVALHINLPIMLLHQRTGSPDSAIANFAGWREIGNIGVDIFFIISGFVMAFTMAKYAGRPGAFIGQRIGRIVPVYWVVTLIWAIALISADLPPKLPDVISSLTILPLLPTFAMPVLTVGWTLSFEFTFYSLVCLTLACGRGPRTLLALVCGLAAVGCLWTAPIALIRWLTHPVLLEFALGVWAFLLWSKGSLPRWLLIAGAVVGAASLASQFALGPRPPVGVTPFIDGTSSLDRVIHWAIPAFLVFNLLLHWRPSERPAARAAKLVGDASYSIYLAHPIVIPPLVYGLPLPPDLRWIVCFAAATVAGIAVYVSIERPLVRLSHMSGALFGKVKLLKTLRIRQAG